MAALCALGMESRVDTTCLGGEGQTGSTLNGTVAGQIIRGVAERQDVVRTDDPAEAWLRGG